jgi:hypothetical protein
MKPTTGSQNGTYADLVGADATCYNSLHLTAALNRVRNSSHAAVTSSRDRVRRGRTNTSKPANSRCSRLKVSRTKRLRRLRSTARRATRFPTKIPKRANTPPLNDTCTRKRSLLEFRRERRRVLKARPPERRARRLRPSDRKPLAAFGAAVVEKLASSQCLHAGPEPVRTRTANFGRLVSAFHWESRRVREKAWY